MNLVLPISLDDGVKIISKSVDGAFVISYVKRGGETGFVKWPDRFKRFHESNPDEGHAIKIVQTFVINSFQDETDPGDSRKIKRTE